MVNRSITSALHSPSSLRLLLARRIQPIQRIETLLDQGQCLLDRFIVARVDVSKQPQSLARFFSQEQVL